MAPVLVAPATCLAACGYSWDTLQRVRKQHGLPLLKLGRQSPAIELAPLLEALRADAASVEPPSEPSAPRQVAAVFTEKEKAEGEAKGPEQPAAASQIRADADKNKSEPARSLSEITEAARAALRTRVGGSP